MDTPRKAAVQDEAKKVVDILSRFVNGFNREEREAFVTALMIEHRTLQQSMARLFFQCIGKWAEYGEKGMFDGRNEATCKLCKKIVDTFGDEMGLPYI
jgi:hypothetical protein